MQDGYREDRVILAHGAVQDRGVTPLLDDLVRRTTQRLGGGGGAVTLLGDRAPVVHREPQIDSVPGWGTRVRACWPDPPTPYPAGSHAASPTGLQPARGQHLLTLREREVRALVEQGLADKQIATRLAISVKTVEKHVGAVLRKTGARNRTILARFGAAT